MPAFPGPLRRGARHLSPKLGEKPLNKKNLWRKITLEDFAEFDKAGLTHPDLHRMKRTLGDLDSKAPSP